MPASNETSHQDHSRARKVLINVREYLATETASAVVLLGAALVALLWINLPFGDSYESFWGSDLTLGSGDWSITRDIEHWINEGLMTAFFFVVALEIKRELLDGELKGARRAALPVIAAAGGMIVPALLYLLVNAGGATDGWGVPVATDIAFALGVAALVAPGLPQSARVFLLSLAIVDDVGAILIIAIAYTSGLVWANLAIAAGALLAIFVSHRVGINFWPLHLTLALVAWLATLESGIHATIAGVALGFVTPVISKSDRPSAGEWLEDKLHPWTSFLVLPLFALANAGFEISASTLSDAASSRITLGIVVGLVVGKPLGIYLAVAFAERFRLGALPEGTARKDILGLGAVAGIGFTVSLFIADLAFASQSLVREATIGVVAASLVAAGLGSLVLQRRGHDPEKINR